MRLAAAQRFRGAPQREITESDRFHETQSLLNFRDETGGDCFVRAFEFQPADRARCFAGRKIRELVDGVALHAHVTRHRVQARAATARAFARFAFLDPFRFALRCEFVFENRFAVAVGGCLQILVPDFAEPAAFFARAVRRIE